MAAAELINVSVVYALPGEQDVIPLQVPPGTTLLEAARRSGLAERYGLTLEALQIGVFGKVEKAPQERLVRAGDRIEFYRPLLIDPKAARQARAEKLRAAKAGKR